MGIWQSRLDAIASGASELPNVTEKLSLGRLDRWQPGSVEKSWQVAPHFCTAEGTTQQALFGGYVAALADQVLAFTTMTILEDHQHFRTTDLTLSFFNTISHGRVRICGSVVNQNRRMIHVSADFFREDGKKAAQARAVQLLLRVNKNVNDAMKAAGMMDSPS